MKKKLYSWICFNKKGNFRGFSSGYSKVEAKRLILKDFEEGNLIIQVDSLSVLPTYFIESHYWKTSTNNDLETFLKTQS